MSSKILLFLFNFDVPARITAEVNKNCEKYETKHITKNTEILKLKI